MKTNATILIALLAAVSLAQADGFERFITARDGKLMDGDEEFRFISFNIPNLHYVEDDMGFENTMPFRMPDPYEIDDALHTIQQMGGRVARTYTLSVFKKNEPAGIPKHVLAPGKFNEEAFAALDRVLASANRHGVRLIIPFVNNFQWWGGVEDYAAFRGKARNEFWTDPQLIEDIKQTIRFVIERVNTVTGVPYKEDKAVLAWETGNETECPHSWTHEIAAYIKSLDSNHLVMDGFNTSVLREETIADPLIDVVQTHHYEHNPQDMLEHILTSVRMVNGRKPYLLGEFGFVSTEAVRAVLETAIREGLSGALIWSLRYHHRDGGFFWHSEPAGGDFFKAYHWPGFDTGEVYDERDLMALMREKAFAINGEPIPALPVPAPPEMLPCRDVSAIGWRGCVGASGYDIERAESASGPWTAIACNVSDAAFQYRPLFCDVTAEIGKSYFYRARARNAMGVSEPGKPIGPVRVEQEVLVDEFHNDGAIFFRRGQLRFAANEARKYKEDIHRIEGGKGDFLIYRTSGAISAGFIYAFSNTAQPRLSFGVSINGRDFQPVSAEIVDFGSGEGEYGYLTPVLYKLESIPTDCRYLKIEWNDPTSLSRVEIRYGS